jgi:hypothetical protein
MSVAGLLNNQKLTKNDALSKVIDFKGKVVVLATHPVFEKPNLNCIKYHDKTPNTLYVCQTNRNGTQIFSFEYAVIKKGITKDFILQKQGKNGAIAGILDNISVEGNILPRFRIQLVDAKIDFDE